MQARLDTKCVFRFQDGHCSWHSFKVATSCSQHSHSALEQRVCTFLNQGSLRLRHLRRGGRSAHGWRRRRRPAAPPDGAPRSRCALRAPRSARQTIPLGSAFWAMANCTADLRSHAACAQESAGSCVDPEGRGQLGETSAPTARTSPSTRMDADKGIVPHPAAVQDMCLSWCPTHLQQQLAGALHDDRRAVHLRPLLVECRCVGADQLKIVHQCPPGAVLPLPQPLAHVPEAQRLLDVAVVPATAPPA